MHGHVHGCTLEKRRVIWGDEKKKKNVETNRAFDGHRQKYRHKFRTARHRHTDQNLPQKVDENLCIYLLPDLSDLSPLASLSRSATLLCVPVTVKYIKRTFHITRMITQANIP